MTRFPDWLRPQRSKDSFSVPVIAVGVIVALIVSFMSPGALTGLAVFEIPQENFTNGTYAIVDPVTELYATGILNGEGDATLTFVTPNGTYLIGTVTSDPGTPRTLLPSYDPGDLVEIEHSPTDATYYLDDGVTSQPVTPPFPAPVADAELLIVANESGDLTAYRVPVLIGNQTRETPFEDLCEETCTLPGLTGTIEIESTADVELTVYGDTPTPNRAPELLIPIPDQVVAGTVQINLDLHFADADGDDILYSVGSSDYVDAEVNGSVVTITPVQAGQDTLFIFASDLDELVDEVITVIVPAIDVQENETNETEETPPVNETVVPEPIQNTTQTLPPQNVTQNQTYDTALDCSAPDPNKRPLDCLNLEAERYFEQDVYLEDVARQRVARVTSIGNLLITGGVIQGSVAQPRSGSFLVSYKDNDFNTVPSAWIDEDGNLHLRGQLHEEVKHVTPPSGSYAVINRRGVYLAYVDRQAGDLYIRGNVIPYRSDIG